MNIMMMLLGCGGGGAPAPAGPTLVQMTTYSNQLFQTAVTLVLPAGIAAGNVLVAVLRIGAARTITPPAGWSLVASDETDMGFYIYRKTALSDGTEGGTTVTWTASASVKSCFAFLEVTAPLDQVEAAFATTSENPPSQSPTGGAAATVWAAITTARKNSNSVDPPAPTGYTAATPLTVESSATNSTSAGEVTLGAAYKESSAATEDPGAYTWSGDIATGPQAATISVR